MDMEDVQAAHLEAYRGLDDDELRQAIFDEFSRLQHVEIADLDVTVMNGSALLDGTVPSESARAALEQTLSDRIGLIDYTIRLRVDPAGWTRGEHAPGLRRPEGKSDEEVLSHGEDAPEDVYESLDQGAPYSPPEHFQPDEDPRQPRRFHMPMPFRRSRRDARRLRQ